MEMPQDDAQLLEDMLAKLEEIRDKLIRVNEAMGYAARVSAMKREILEVGWDGILARYHPDINIDDPAAGPLFELYRFVYDSMEKG